MTIQEKMSELAPADLATVSEAAASEREKRDRAAFMRRDPGTMNNQDFDRWKQLQLDRSEQAKTKPAAPAEAAEERPMPVQPVEDVAALDDLAKAAAEEAAKRDEEATRRVVKVQQDLAEKRELEWMNQNLGRLSDAELITFRRRVYGF